MKGKKTLYPTLLLCLSILFRKSRDRFAPCDQSAIHGNLGHLRHRDCHSWPYSTARLTFSRKKNPASLSEYITRSTAAVVFHRVCVSIERRVLEKWFTVVLKMFVSESGRRSYVRRRRGWKGEGERGGGGGGEHCLDR